MGEKHHYKGFVIEQTGLHRMVWMDFVTLHWAQPRFPTLARAKACINAEIKAWRLWILTQGPRECFAGNHSEAERLFALVGISYIPGSVLS